MTASMASWTTALSSVTPKNAPMTAPSSSPISRMAWCAARPNCIRRISRRIRIPEIAFSVEARVRRQGVGSILFRKLIAEARAKGYKSLRITTGAQNEAMRALANKFGAHLTFRHGESTGIIDLTASSTAGTRDSVASLTPIDAAARDREFQPRLLGDAVPDVRLGPRRLSRTNAKRAIRRSGEWPCNKSSEMSGFRYRCACRCRIA